ncbi:MAG: glycerol kinase GlpK [Microthrixaceae bacterium]|nr:glycerol kinase GlpK [Microthrixaceae bacterium]
MPWIIAIDAGTTGVRAIASRVTGEGPPEQVAAYREFTQHFPRPGWVEHDPEEIWDVTQQVLSEASELIRRHTGASDPVAAVGMTNQRETLVAWSASTGRPVHPAIVWQDRRTAELCERLTRDGELPRIRRLTGLVLDPYFSATKASWMLSQGGVEADGDLRLGTIDSWLLWKLTGGRVHATDVTNASRTMLFDITTLEWSPELLELFGVPRSSLPEVRPSAGVFGHTAPECVLGAGVPIAGIAGDQQASLFGQACVEPGMAKNTYGTGSFVLMNVGSAPPPVTDALLGTVAWQLPATALPERDHGGNPDATVTHYALEGAIFSTGSAVQWLRDGLGIMETAAELEPLARSVEDNGGVVLVPAFTGLGSPWWDPAARGTIVGITRGTSRAHLARATVEAMVHQSRDVVDAMVSASGRPLSELRVDGGAAVMDLLCQMQADQLGVPVARSHMSETTAMGATYLAGLGCGLFGDVAEVASAWSADATFRPGGDREALDAAHETWLRAVQRSLAWG